MPEIAVIAEASVNGIPLIFVVMGLVQWFKDQGVATAQLKRVSLATGLVIGVGYQVSVLPAEAVPATALGFYTLIFGFIMYGLALGLIASGIYDTLDGIFKKAVGR